MEMTKYQIEDMLYAIDQRANALNEDIGTMSKQIEDMRKELKENTLERIDYVKQLNALNAKSEIGEKQ